LHDRSSAAQQRRFVAVNCAALPTELIESEAFWPRKGRNLRGRRPAGGENSSRPMAAHSFWRIGDMSATVQAKLLRALEERRIERLGGDESIPVDVRIVSATHRALEEES